MVYIPESAVRKVDKVNLPKEFIAITNASEKEWPADKWVQLLNKMKKVFNLPVLEVSVIIFIDTSFPISQSLCGKLSILESAEVIRRAKLFIGINSGSARLANTLGTMAIISLGHFRGFEEYNPFRGHYRNGKKSRIIYESGPTALLSVDEVLNMVS